MLYRMCERCEAMRKKRDAVAIIDPTCHACSGVGFVPVKVTREEMVDVMLGILGEGRLSEVQRCADAALALLEGGA